VILEVSESTPPIAFDTRTQKFVVAVSGSLRYVDDVPSFIRFDVVPVDPIYHW